MIDKKITDDMLSELLQHACVIANRRRRENAFFEDLCTYKEIEQMAQRITAARLLLEGNTYARVIERTDISSATLSRVSRCIQHGSGGYKKFIKTE
ncbi:MAG: YerC/YecD family TrpR-related protein [Clostridiales bacterium]|nr:MAG: YerC/YecD family TrpR-related protein [Clostridiales bacterium]